MRKGKKKGRRKPRASMAQIATRVVQKALLKTLEPNYSLKEFGSLDASGQVDDSVDIVSGPLFGLYYPFPEIEKDIGKKGWHLGNRESPSIHVNGISLKGFFILPSAQSCATVQMYFGTTKRPDSSTDNSIVTVDEAAFPAPDNIDNMRRRDDEVRRVRKVYWSKRMKLTHGGNWKSAGGNNEVIADRQVPFQKYFKFKKPIQIQYDGNNADDWVGRRFFLCIKAHTVDANNPVKAVFNVVTYYRDD